MITEYNIQDELKSMGSFLADIPRTMPYAVPVGYFENFEGTVNNIIKGLDETELTPAWTKTLPYTVPQGYFEALPGELVARTTTPVLPKAIPFNIPAGYFETLPAQMLQSAKANGNRAIPLKRYNILKSVKWAAAAILVLGIGLGSYRVFFNMQQISGTESILSSVPNNEIQDYLQHNYIVDIDKIAGNNTVNNMNIDNKDIIQYLNETGWE